MRTTWVGLAVLFAAACGGGSSTRYFRVLAPLMAGAGAQPDSCYQQPTLPAASSADEIAAQTYCGVGKKPTATGSMTTTVGVASWTMVDVGDNKLFLLMAPNGTPATSGIPGTYEGGKYVFTSEASSFQKQCPGGGINVVECNGACVNTRSDPQNCGTCGLTCASGTVCQFGMCRPACPPPVTGVCNAVSVNLQTDDANCGVCARACTGGLTCSGGICVEPCQAACSDKYQAAGCGMPRQFSRSTQQHIEFTVSGGNLAGTASSTLTFSCTAPGCSTDFAQRCPTCEVSAMVSGSEAKNVTEQEQR